MSRRGTGSVPGNVPDSVGLARSLRHDARYVVSLRGLPLRVATFLWRAHRHAVRSGDRFSRDSAIRPAEVVELLALARGRNWVVDLGTGTGWSALVLALDDSGRRVVSYDPVFRSERQDYLAMVDPSVRERIDLRDELDTSGARPGEAVELLFVDSSHDCDSVAAAFAAWRDALAPRAVVAFHDYGHPDYPGVREAVRQLELSGEERGGLFVWRAP
jgi:predicted O-methyltransferase YrrM